MTEFGCCLGLQIPPIQIIQASLECAGQAIPTFKRTELKEICNIFRGLEESMRQCIRAVMAAQGKLHNIRHMVLILYTTRNVPHISHVLTGFFL